jgi:hypothetical protein
MIKQRGSIPNKKLIASLMLKVKHRPLRFQAASQARTWAITAW